MIDQCTNQVFRNPSNVLKSSWFSTAKPGILDIAGRGKWDGWNAMKGKDKETAMKEYIQ